MEARCGTKVGVYEGVLMPRLEQRLCVGMLAGERKDLEYEEARIGESLLHGSVVDILLSPNLFSLMPVKLTIAQLRLSLKSVNSISISRRSIRRAN